MKTCSACEIEAVAKGLCEKHYRRLLADQRGGKRTAQWDTTEKERLEHKASAPTATGCIEYMGSRNARGYGTIRFKGKSWLAHRLAYCVATNGPVPEGLSVLHRCDNPSCMNVAHLFLGTIADNVQDMYAKGRQRIVRGFGHPRTKLTRDAILAIRADARSHPSIAKDHGISPATVQRIRARTIWRDVE